MPPSSLIMRRLRKLVGWSILIILLLYAGGNLWLSSRWGTGVVERVLKERTRMDWAVGGITWSPWRGVILTKVTMRQPDALREQVSDPVLAVDQMRVQPYYRPLMRGKLRLREVFIESPKLTVAVEMLAYLSAGSVRAEPVPAVVRPVKPTEPAAHGDPSESIKSNPPVASKARVEPGKSASPPAKPDRPPVGLPLTLSIKNAQVTLVSASRGLELVRLGGVGLVLPLLGEDAVGGIHIAQMKVHGLPVVERFKQSISWNRPYLHCENTKVDFGGVVFGYRVQLGIGGGIGARAAFPFLLDLALPAQKLSEVEWLRRVALGVDAEEVSGRFRCSGMARSPVTWRGNMIFTGSQIRVKEEHGGQDVFFDEAVFPAVFRQGALQWSGARVIGEDVSVLGNGHLSMSGGVISVTRFVVSPEVGKMVSRALNGAGVVRNGDGWWADLDTPDRKVRDLLVTGALMDPVIDAGDLHDELPLSQVVGSTFQFIRGEMLEEGVKLESGE